MIHEMGNVELFELRETIPKLQFSECLFCWTQGIVCCTCGHLLRENESSRHLHQWQLDVLSIPHYIIKMERPHGARHGETEAQIEHYVAHSARKRCIRKNFDGIHDRVQRDSVYRDSQLKMTGPRRAASQWKNWHRKNRLHRESGEERAEPILFQHDQRWHPSSSSSSWWNWDKSWWSS